MVSVLIIGSGGREHAIGLALAKSNQNPSLYFAPGNAGTATLGTNVPIEATSISELVTFAKQNSISITLVGPEDPLVMGIVDRFEQENLAIIGPNKLGAQLEGSKKWAKQLMTKYNIPTAGYRCFTNFDDAATFVTHHDTFPIVIKANGLAAGKGVTIAETKASALTALKECLVNQKFKDAGLEVIIEDFLEGDEASIFAFTDSKTIRPMLAAQDHKAIGDGDTGPNTGGMGAYCPTPLVTPELYEKVNETIFKPLLAGLQKEGIHYKGIIYAGLMISKEGDVSIVEFNVRFGDPETQVVLPLLETDLVSIFQAIYNETLADITLKWSAESAVCVVLASGGYPNNYEKGKVISGLTTTNQESIIHAGTKQENKSIVTSGGRVLGVVSKAPQLTNAITTAYQCVNDISFENMVYRSDIGKKAARYN
ncbi:phosphoribosylamine--glycine ligase [bacterium]|nr:phosphoribosylamine--glycine ligase [bacterium]